MVKKKMCDYRFLDNDTIKKIVSVSTVSNTVKTTSNLSQTIQNNRGH